jgi:hypothetical protein
MPKNSGFKITFGGWYQRTTLHLSEIYDLFELGHSKLRLSEEKLKELHKHLDLKKVTREAEYLEFVKAKTNSGIEIRYYEDGLYILETKAKDIKKGQIVLENYFNKILNPALAYIFSLGAPTPKVLANIEATHPTVIGAISSDPENYNIDDKKYGEVYSKITSDDITVYKTPKHIFVVTSPEKKTSIRDLVEMQIFFREFKDQLEKYLDIHRNIWEEISEIKERKFIKGKEVSEVRSKLESYKKTIDLINSRINQMGSYVHTRKTIAKDMKIRGQLVTLFQYKFEVLENTHKYIKEIWNMTKDYINSAIQVAVEIENKSTAVGITVLARITSVGVISGILGYLAGGKPPKITASGAIYFALLILVTWLVNILIGKIYTNRKYKISFTERAKKI